MLEGSCAFGLLGLIVMTKFSSSKSLETIKLNIWFDKVWLITLKIEWSCTLNLINKATKETEEEFLVEFDS
jgi:hypothetical protein